MPNNGKVTLQSKGDVNVVSVQAGDGPTELIRFVSRVQAETAIPLIEARLGKSRPADDVTYSEFYALWLEKHLLPQCSMRYIEQCESTNRHYLSPRLGRLPLSAIAEALPALRRELEAELGPRKAFKRLDILSALCGTAVKWWYLKENPVVAVR